MRDIVVQCVALSHMCIDECVGTTHCAGVLFCRYTVSQNDRNVDEYICRMQS